jgi:hypothetical protein
MLYYDDCTIFDIGFLTGKEHLLPYIPEEYEIVEPFVRLMYQKCNAVRWMGGSEYSLVSVSVPVRYVRGKEPVSGVYQLVIWENNAEPIYGGREEAGMPKIFADIPEYRRMDNDLRVNLSHEGRTFLELELTIQRDYTAEEIAGMNKNNRIVQLGWRYIPKVGPYAGAALSEATYYPVDNEFSSGSVCAGKVLWTVPKPEQHPLQWGIISLLAGLPVLEWRPGSFLKGKSCLRMDLAKSLP